MGGLHIDRNFREQSRMIERRRERARGGRVTASINVGRNGEHFLELGTTTHPLPVPLTPQNILEVEQAIAAFRERCDDLSRTPDVLFSRVEKLPL